nr:TraA family conjugative transfer protein [Pseudomonas luteola]
MDWTQGTLGRIIAIGIILVGACVGVVRQSLMTFAVGLAMGMGLYNAPTVVESIMGSTLSHIAAMPATMQFISNGLSLF